MFLHNPNIVAHPNGYFVNVHARGREQASERVTHHMWSDPCAFHFLHMLSERTPKIVAVTVFAVLCLWMQHEGRAQTVVIANEGQELSSQRDSALLAILKPHRGSLPQVEQSGLEIEPTRNRLDNLRTAQARVKPAKEDKSQILAVAFFNQFIAEQGITETLSRSLIHSGQLDSFDWTAPDDSLLDAPFEKAANGHQITEGAGVRQASAGIPVETLYISRGDVGRGNSGIEAGEERGERVGLVAGRGSAVNIHVPLVGNESLDQSLETVAGRQFRGVPNIIGSGDGFREIAGFEADEFADLGLLVGEPIDSPSEIDAASLFAHEADVTLSASHFANLKSALPGFTESNGERVTRLELATSSLAKKLPDEGTVTLQTSHEVSL